MHGFLASKACIGCQVYQALPFSSLVVVIAVTGFKLSNLIASSLPVKQVMIYNYSILPAPFEFVALTSNLWHFATELSD